MADTSFTSKVTTILANWLQAVNDWVYKGRSPIYATTTGTAGAYVLTLPSGSLYSAYSAGDKFSWKANVTCNAGATLSISGASVITGAALYIGGAAIVAGAIQSGDIVECTYDGTNFQITGGTPLYRFIQSGTGAVATDVQSRDRLVINIWDYMSAGQRTDTTADVADAVQAADNQAATVGGIVYFSARAHKLASKVTKSPYTTWIGHPNSQYGVTANDATGTSGSRITAGFNGTLVEFATQASDIYAGFTGFRGISFFNDPATYASATAISINSGNRQFALSEMTVKGFLYGIYGSPAELYMDTAFVVHNKYGVYLFSVADCWLENVHTGSGSQTTYPDGGIGCTIINGGNITFSSCRFQVQRGGPGCQIQSSRGVHFINPIIDQNDTNGLEIYDSTDIDIAHPDIFDNGTTSVNAAGIKIIAQGYDFTADASTNVITLSSGSATWANGNTIVELTTTGTLPAGLATGTQYYVITGNGSTTFKLASSHSNARAGTAIDITDAGSGTHTIHAVCGSIDINGGRIQDRNNGTAAARSNRAILFAKSAGGGKIRKISIQGTDVSRFTQQFGSTSSVDSEFIIRNCPGWAEVSGDNGNAGTTLTIGSDASTQIWATVLTADRSVTLDTTGAYKGAKWRVVRKASATGAFNINVGSGPLKAMATAGSFADFEYDGSAWFLSAYGTL